MPIHYCGYVNSEDSLAQMYAAANLFLLPSLEDNLPNTVLESMSCGTPVLAFDVGGVPDLVTDGVTGRLAPPGDSRALSACLLPLIAQASEVETWGVNCRQRIRQDFSLRSQTERYSSLYESLNASGPEGAPASATGEIGARLQAIYPRILLASLEHFATTTKRVTAAQRDAGSELIQLLAEASANSGPERDPVRQQKLEQLKSEFMAAGTLRQARLTEHRRRKLARRERFAGLLRKLGIGTE
jgi:hypothetical protein